MLMFDNTAALVPDLDTMEPVSPDVVREIEQGLPAYGCRPIRGGLSALSAHLPLSLYPVLNPGPGHVRACVRGGGGHGGFDALDQIGGLSLTDIASMAGVFAKPQPQSASPTYPANPRHPIVPASPPISPPTEAINANNQGRAAAVSPEAGRTSGRASKGAGKKVLTVAKVKKLLAGAAQKITAKPASTKDDRAARVARLTVDDIAKTGILPADHKPARGRGRHLQLQTMTAEMIAAEAASRLAKNRDAARDSRLKRKNHVVVLEGQVDVLQAKLAAAEGLIAKLQGQVKRLGGR